MGGGFCFSVSDVHWEIFLNSFSILILRCPQKVYRNPVDTPHAAKDRKVLAQLRLISSCHALGYFW